MGNIFGRWEGSDPSLGSVLTGSHCDAIPLAGMYDGTLGVIGAIEALAALKRAVSFCLSQQDWLFARCWSADVLLLRCDCMSCAQLSHVSACAAALCS